MRQRISLARGLLHEPRILLLDEPFSGLDDAGTIWLMRRLCSLRDAGRLIFLTTHDAATAAELADRTWELQRGRLCQVSKCGETDAKKHGRAARVA
jgi:ABC-type multidrug transport system ATPase subunit